MKKNTYAARLANWFSRHRRLRDFTPKGLFQRSLLIIALPVVLMQAGVLWMFFDSQWITVTARLSEGVAGDVAVILKLYEDDPSPQNLQKLAQYSLKKMNLSMRLESGETLPTSTRSSVYSLLDRTVRKALESKIEAPFWFDTTRYPAYVDIRVAVPGGVMRFIAPRGNVFSTTGHIFVFWLTLTTALLTTVAILFIRNQVRPIQRLADAADRFGKDLDAPAFSPSGAREVRQAARAFITMRQRIQRFVEQRTAMLAAVSHDLRTPVTRLKLQFALMEKNADVEAAKADLAEMETMLDAYLAFASGAREKAGAPVDVSALVARIAKNSRRAGGAVETSIATDLVCIGREEALQRCLSNLVNNAMRHGTHVWISAALKAGEKGRGETIRICVDDDGPGLDEAHFEEAFIPFNRFDEARSLNASDSSPVQGVGLGLSIARDIARAHGGDVWLEKSPKGGLRALVSLPPVV